MGLNQQQQDAFDQIKKFLNEPVGASCFLLKGYAGTGKTFLIKTLFTHLQTQDRNVVLIAPTGRAARVIRKRTDCPSKTIHSLIYGMDKFIEEDFDLDCKTHKSYKLVFKLLLDMSDNEAVIIVDEASMVGNVESENEFTRFGSGKLLNDLMEYARCMFHGLHNKIIFVGDPAQLPPVGMNMSPALEAEYLNKHYGVETKEYTLTEIMRQDTGLILKNAMRIRDMIGSFKMRNFELLADSSEVTEISPINALDVAIEGNSYRSRTIFVTYSNAAALRFNELFRERMWGSADGPVRVNELLMVVRNSIKYDLCNGDFCVVREVGHDNEERRISGLDVTLCFRDVVIGHYNQNGISVKTRCKILENALSQSTATLDSKIGRALYIDFCIRNQHLNPKRQPKEFAEAMQRDIYFNALLVKYGYAITCHKAQGGEWDRVIVHFGKGGQTDDTWLRWCYTAVTRAKKDLFLVNSPCVQKINECELGSLNRSKDSTHEVSECYPEKRVCNVPDSAIDHLENSEMEVTIDMVDEVLAEAEQSEIAYNNESCGLKIDGIKESEVLFPDTFLFLTGKFRGYAAVLSEKGFVIQSVEHFPEKYFVRYVVGKETKHVCVQVSFNKAGVFREPQMIGAKTNAPDFVDIVIDCLRHAPELKDAEVDMDFPFQFPFLANKLYPSVKQCVEENGAKIIELTHRLFQERYKVQSGLQSCCFDMIYRADQTLSETRVQSVYCTSREFSDEVLGWLKNEGLA